MRTRENLMMWSTDIPWINALVISSATLSKDLVVIGFTHSYGVGAVKYL